MVLLPRVKLCIAVVPRTPVAVKVAAPAVPAEIVAVGVPLLIFTKPALAEEVAEPPTKRSQVSLSGERAPRLDLQLLLPPAPESSSLHCRTPEPLVVKVPPLALALQSTPVKVMEEPFKVIVSPPSPKSSWPLASSVPLAWRVPPKVPVLAFRLPLLFK